MHDAIRVGTLKYIVYIVSEHLLITKFRSWIFCVCLWIRAVRTYQNCDECPWWNFRRVRYFIAVSLQHLFDGGRGGRNGYGFGIGGFWNVFWEQSFVTIYLSKFSETIKIFCHNNIKLQFMFDRLSNILTHQSYPPPRDLSSSSLHLSSLRSWQSVAFSASVKPKYFI